MGKPVFPCTRCVEAGRCRWDFLYVDCAALDAYKKACAVRRLKEWRGRGMNCG